MKLSLRLWILGIALAAAIISIMSGDAINKLLVFVLIAGTLAVFTFIKSKVGRVFISVVFILFLF